MSGSFVPAKLDVDPSIINNKLSIVDKEDDIESMFRQMSASTQPKIESLIPEMEYPSLLVYPKPGLCVKTRNAGGKKFFLNVCRLQEIPAPTPITEQELQRVIADEDYTTLWKVPMSIGNPREDKDKSGVECLVADVAINSKWLKETMEPSIVFTTFVITVAMEGLHDKHGEDARLDRDRWMILKNKKYHGSSAAPAHRIQKRASTGIKQIDHKEESNKIKELNADTSSNIDEGLQTAPLYKIEKNRKENPTELEASVFLPGVDEINLINLDIGGDRLLLETLKTKYLLDIFLPYSIDENTCSATYRTQNHLLTIRMPILQT